MGQCRKYKGNEAGDRGIERRWQGMKGKELTKGEKEVQTHRRVYKREGVRWKLQRTNRREEVKAGEKVREQSKDVMEWGKKIVSG